jgi:uncharacterized protein (DUF1015 family)
MDNEMLDIRPFKGTRPHKELAEKIIAPSSDYLREEGIIDIHEKHYWNYLKILNPVGQNKKKEALKIAKDQFTKMKEHHIVKKDNKVCYYIYRIQTSEHCQTGFLSLINIDSFINNKVKGHELTYKQRISERADQMLNLQAQIGPIYVSYIDNKKLDDFIEKQTLSIPQYDFKSFDGSNHSLWCLEDDILIEQFSVLVNKLELLYIADGHHRMDAMVKLSNNKSLKNKDDTINIKYKYFMVAAFPKSQSKIYDYNRVIKDLNCLSINEFLLKLKVNFDCEKSSTSVRPIKLREFGMYHDNTWYLLRFKNEHLLKNDILSKLDINIIDQFCLSSILGIKDANTDDRIRFIAGCHGLGALEKKVNENPNSVAFSIFPTKMSDVVEVANNNLTMPPKTTWFDPKPLDGLVVFEFDQ